MWLLDANIIVVGFVALIGVWGCVAIAIMKARGAPWWYSLVSLFYFIASAFFIQLFFDMLDLFKV